MAKMNDAVQMPYTRLKLDNTTSVVLRVYATGSDTVDGVTDDPGVALTNTKRCLYIAKTSSAWISAQLGAVSA